MRISRIIPSIAIIALIGLAAGPARAAEQRVALVIGNGAYRNAPALRNPVNDAEDMAAALSRLGFRVIKRTDVDRVGMREAVRAFENDIRRGGVGLFFYAGHGLQVDGENYLVPIDADLKKKYDVPDQCLAASYLLGAMEEANNRLNIIILDACRDNPFRGFRGGSRGLAQMNAPVGSLLAYATAPGSVASDGSGRNGLYTSNLLKYMAVPGQGLFNMFMNVRREVKEGSDGQQVPWETHSLTEDFYMIQAGVALAPAPVALPEAPPASAPVRIPETGPAPAPTHSQPSRTFADVFAFDYPDTRQHALVKTWKRVDEYTRDSQVPNPRKIGALNRFLEIFGKDIPETQVDDDLRRLAAGRLNHLQRKQKHYSEDRKAWVGIQVKDFTTEEVAKLTQPTGVLVQAVERGGPAELAGLRAEDRILEFGGRPIETSAEVVLFLEEIAPGTPVDVKIVRSGRPIDLKLRPGEKSRAEIERQQQTLTGNQPVEDFFKTAGSQPVRSPQPAGCFIYAVDAE